MLAGTTGAWTMWVYFAQLMVYGKGVGRNRVRDLMAKKKKFETGHCPFCDCKRADVVAEHIEEHIEQYDGYYYEVTCYRVLECRGCGKHYFKSTSSNSEDTHRYVNPSTGEDEVVENEVIRYWPPAAKRRPPEWSDKIRSIDHILGSLFDDVYTALSNNLGVLAAIGMRTVFDRASELLDIDTTISFKQKLTNLKDSDHITGKERAALDSLIDAGSAAVHRGWRPRSSQLDAMMTILEAFLHRAFLLEEIGAKLGKGVPKKNPNSGE